MAKNKTKQIGILADLNCCSRDKIKEILKSEGFMEEKKTVSTRRKKKESVDSKKAADMLAIKNIADAPVMIELEDQTQVLPEPDNQRFDVTRAIESLMDGAIEDEIKLYEQQIEKLEAKKQRLEVIYKALASFLKV